MNKRKFRIWDNKLIFSTLQKVIQINAKIEERCEKDVTLDMLPHSQFPTDILYDITSCFEAMYYKLLEEDLIVAGYPKPTNLLH